MILHDHVALVTGAAKEDGIGFSSARKMAIKGATIVLTDTPSSEKLLISSAEKLAQETGIKVLPVVCDVTDDASMQACVEKVMDKLGRIDILFNNAGVGALKDFTDSDVEMFDLMYRINVRGPVMMCKLIVPIMQAQGRGVIINNSSTCGVYGSAGQTHYCASKHAVVGFTKSLAAELGKDNIRVLAVAPGFIHTDMWVSGLEKMGLDPEEEMAKLTETVSLDRFAQPSEVGDFVAYAASSEASYLTGSYYFVHGGAPIDGLV